VIPVSEQLQHLPSYLTAHLQLALLAILIGTSISIPLGVLLSRRARFERPVLLVVNTIQTVPALALLALMVPLLAALRLPSIGFLPAFLALVLYSLLPILRNTVSGLASISPALTEAARAVGMTSRQQLLRVELPLATPMILAGVRTAAAWTVGMATLATPVGSLSLGNYIFGGLQTRNYAAVLVGCSAAACLALVLDAVLALLAAGLANRRRGRVLGAAFCLLVLYGYVTVSLALPLLAASRQPLVVGAKNFTEQYVLSEILAQHLRNSSGRRVRVRSSLGSSVAFEALRHGQIDAYVEYSGTLWTTVLQNSGPLPARDTVLAEVRSRLEDNYGIRVMAKLGFENAYALAMRRARAKRLGVSTLSDLTRCAGDLSLGTDYEFLERPAWKAIAHTYALSFASKRAMDPSLMYDAVHQGSVDVISAFTTDPRIAAYDLVLLADDRGVIPPYDAVILVGPRVWRLDSKSARLLASLEGSIDVQEMRHMNLRIDREHESPAKVAHDFLEHIRQGGSASRPPSGVH